jgi:hypothetical protein
MPSKNPHRKSEQAMIFIEAKKAVRQKWLLGSSRAFFKLPDKEVSACWQPIYPRHPTLRSTNRSNGYVQPLKALKALLQQQ